MIMAELNRKLPLVSEHKEDLLTSDIITFFKYCKREIFLKQYLLERGIKVSNDDVNHAEFKFWPRFGDKTEPDLVLIVGKYYLLIEANFRAGFGSKTKKTKA